MSTSIDNSRRYTQTLGPKLSDKGFIYFTNDKGKQIERCTLNTEITVLIINRLWQEITLSSLTVTAGGSETPNLIDNHVEIPVVENRGISIGSPEVVGMHQFTFIFKTVHGEEHINRFLNVTKE